MSDAVRGPTTPGRRRQERRRGGRSVSGAVRGPFTPPCLRQALGRGGLSVSEAVGRGLTVTRGRRGHHCACGMSRPDAHARRPKLRGVPLPSKGADGPAARRQQQDPAVGCLVVRARVDVCSRHHHAAIACSAPCRCRGKGGGRSCCWLSSCVGPRVLGLCASCGSVLCWGRGGDQCPKSLAFRLGVPSCAWIWLCRIALFGMPSRPDVRPFVPYLRLCPEPTAGGWCKAEHSLFFSGFLGAYFIELHSNRRCGREHDRLASLRLGYGMR